MAFVALLGALLVSPVALASAPADCKPLEWAPAPLPGFEISECRTLDYVAVTLHTESGAVDLKGKQTRVRYTLSDKSRNPTAAQARDTYAALEKEAGGVLQTKPKEGFNAYSRKKTATGEVWFTYDHGSGNEKSTTSYTLSTIDVGGLVQHVEAQPLKGPLETAGCKDPQWQVKVFPDFKLDHCNNRDFDTVRFRTEQGEKTLAGHVHEAVYALTDRKKSVTALELWQNYVNALQKIGATLISSPRDANVAVLSQKTPDGELHFIYRHASGNDETTGTYSLITVQAGGPPAKRCTLEVYGVNFDFDRATLRPDSEPVLNELLSLFTQDPEWTGEVSGHTDNKGKPDYNLQLSRERAEAGKSWLVSRGVDASRLETQGYGDTHPLVTNDTEEHRAKNRRVELKRDGCK